MEHFLRGFFEIDGVTGALLIDKDGLIIASALDPARAEMHAAQAATAFDGCAAYASQISPGSARMVTLETGTHAILIAAAADLLIVVETSANTQLGHLRLEARRVAAAITNHLRG